MQSFQEFKGKLSEFAKEFNQADYTDRRAKIIYNNMKMLGDDEVNEIFSICISSEKFLPTPTAIIQVVNNRFSTKRDLTQTEGPDCPKCDNSGQISTWVIKEPWRQTAFACNCDHSSGLFINKNSGFTMYSTKFSKTNIPFYKRHPNEEDFKKARQFQNMKEAFPTQFKEIDRCFKKGEKSRCNKLTKVFNNFFKYNEKKEQVTNDLAIIEFNGLINQFKNEDDIKKPQSQLSFD